MDCIYELRDTTSLDNDGMYFPLRIFKSAEDAIAWVESVPEDHTLSFHDCEDSDELFELVELPFNQDLMYRVKTIVEFSRILTYDEGEDRYYWRLEIKQKEGVK